MKLETMLMKELLPRCSVIPFGVCQSLSDDKYNLETFKSALITLKKLHSTEEIFYSNYLGIFDQKLKKIFFLQALMLRLEIFRYYIGLLKCNYIPAFFELRVFLKKFAITLRCDQEVFQEFSKSLDGISSFLPSSNNSIIIIMELLKKHKMLNFIIRKIDIKPQAIEVEVASFIKNEVEDIKLTGKVNADFKSFDPPLKQISENIQNHYNDLSEQQKQELYKIRLKTPLFSVSYNQYKEKNSYLFWERDINYHMDQLNKKREQRWGIQKSTTDLEL